MEEHGLAKGDFNNAQKLINDCRKIGLLPLDICSEDDGRQAEHLEEIDDQTPKEFAGEWIDYVRNSAHQQFTPISFWDDLDVYLEMTVEKIDLKSLFSSECEEFHVPLSNISGWNDINSRAAIMRRFAHWESRGKKCVLLHTAAPPDVLRVDEKNLREYSVLNCIGLIITTNHKADGIYLPGDDRRHYVAWSELSRGDFSDDYWPRLWGWYANGGDGHVAAYLAAHDLSAFDAKAPPPKTAAFWDIVDANRAPEDAELADVIDDIGNPDAITLERVRNKAEGDFADWIKDRKNRRAIPHRFEQCGYAPVRNEAAKDGMWKIGGKRQGVYARSALPVSERLRAARHLAGDC